MMYYLIDDEPRKIGLDFAIRVKSLRRAPGVWKSPPEEGGCERGLRSRPHHAQPGRRAGGFRSSYSRSQNLCYPWQQGEAIARSWHAAFLPAFVCSTDGNRKLANLPTENFTYITPNTQTERILPSNPHVTLKFNGNSRIFDGSFFSSRDSRLGGETVEKHAGFELELWREVGRHLELAESLDRMLPVLARRLPFEWVLIRQIDPDRRRIETLFRAPLRGGPDELSSISEPGEKDLKKLLDWWSEGAVLRLDAKSASQRLPGLVPGKIRSDVLCGALRGDSRNQCALLVSARRDGFQSEHEQVFAAVLEPFSVALESDHRLRELETLREAAEAYKQSLLARLGRLDIADSIVGGTRSQRKTDYGGGLPNPDHRSPGLFSRVRLHQAQDFAVNPHYSLCFHGPGELATSALSADLRHSPAPIRIVDQ
jgi:hypothetical protein